MVTTLMRSTLREIRQSLGRYLAILAIVGLGVSFFAGLRMSEPDMKATGVDYLDEFRFFDLRLLSTLGYGPWANVTIIGMQFLDFFDFISNSVLMPIVALCTCIFVGYVLKPQALIDEVELTGKFKKKALFTIVIKYFAPICIVLILVSSVLSAFGLFTM